ncbi:hypothetical protein [Geodermatophilus ruber]|uniref:Uncharacterized protein n=1 Tax=Geodermatophilus ruber TaxID=504800 RepID=A0A1I4GS22_9ACTN|nr:hypothetical protein [Geodermatophilus ruber]SFL32785.1 hypothetical protein SAMN04488085_109154 [Geodermatophilus ruber]
MREAQEPATEGTPADHARSGADVAEAIEAAERGSSVQEVHDRGTEAAPGSAPVEQAAGDPEMTEGQVVLGEGAASGSAGSGPAAPEGVSGGRQSVQGARASDRAAAEPEEDPA